MSDRDIHLSEETLNEAISSAQGCLDEAKSKKGRFLLEASNEVRSKIKYVDSCFNLYNSELMASDFYDDPTYKGKFNNYKEIIRDLKKQSSLLGKDGKSNNGIKDINAMSVDEKLDLANEIQQGDIQSLIEATQLVEESKQLGMKTIENLVEQNEKLDNASEYVRVLDSNLDIAKKELAAIRRGMCGDATIRVILIVLVVIAVVAIFLLIFAPPADKIIEGFKPKNKK